MRPQAAVCLALVAALTPAAAGGPAETFPPQRMAVSGAPEQIGRTVGARYRDFIREHQPVFLALAVASTRQTPRDLYARSRDLASKLTPEDAAEIRGLASGAGIGHDEALFLSMFYALTRDSVFCRQLAAWGSATADGELLHARNLDWLDYPGGPLARNNLVLNVRPEQGHEYLALTWPGLTGVITGANRHGLTLGFNEIADRRPETRVAEPVFFTLKRILRACSTCEQAVALIRQARPLGSASILIADSRRKVAVVVEVLGGDVATRSAEGDMIGNANHATRESGILTPAAGVADWPTCTVAKTMLPLDVEAMQAVMADPRVIQEINLLTVIFQPSRNRMRLSCGRQRAAEGVFQEMAMFPDDAATPRPANRDAVRSGPQPQP